MTDSNNEGIQIPASGPDVNENNILSADTQLLNLLLADRTTNQNILWMTDNYIEKGSCYRPSAQIMVPLITGKFARVIKPRINKSKKEQVHRIRDKAEVFSPSWICNCQNNLIDEAWFGRGNVFNKEKGKSWSTITEKVSFPKNKLWEDYVIAQRLEVACGEAPYLVSRYDTTTGEMLPVRERIGLLDRKLRIVSENTKSAAQWVEWSKKAVQSVYGYEWQGDSLLLARENIILSFIDHYKDRFKGENPSIELIREIAVIVSWNLWQMDGIKFVIPCSCHDVIKKETDLFETRTVRTSCEGCKTGNKRKHNGIYCRIRDWQTDEILTAVSMFEKG